MPASAEAMMPQCHLQDPGEDQEGGEAIQSVGESVRGTRILTWFQVPPWKTVITDKGGKYNLTAEKTAQ